MIVGYHLRIHRTPQLIQSIGCKETIRCQRSDGSITQFRSSLNEIDVRGRFPANILVSDDMLNDGSESKSSGGSGEKTLGTLGKNGIYNKGWGKDENADGLGGYKDKGSNSRYYDIDKWFEKLLND